MRISSRTRLTLIVFGLVIVPTALLSLVASRVLTNWGLILQARAKQEATGTLDAVSCRVEARLADDMTQVRATVGQVLTAGGEIGAVGKVAASLRVSRPMVKDVFVFMDPRGFIWPSSEIEAHDVSRRTEIVAALRREIEKGRPVAGALALTVDHAFYCFAPAPGSQAVYVGYEIDAAAFGDFLCEVIEGLSHAGLILSAEGAGLTVCPVLDTSSAVVISDSPGGQTEHIGSEPAQAYEVLATDRLGPPFGEVTLKASARDPERDRRAARLQSRLAGWAIMLLAAGVVIGTVLVVWESTLEVRHARARSDFVIGVSHDLRTPVASLIVLAESLQRGAVKDALKREKFIGTILHESERLSRLIERVLMFVRFGQDAMVYARRIQDVGEIVRAAVRVFESWSAVRPGGIAGGKAEPAGHAGRVALRIAADRLSANVDGAILTQALLNLLDNAVKYGTSPPVDGPPGGGTVAEVEVSVDALSVRRAVWRRRRRWIRIAVRDHGPGIDRRDLRRLFKHYYRGRGAADKNVSGVGLGLALCKHVTEKHDGFISVESVPGQGSTFTIWLPGVET